MIRHPFQCKSLCRSTLSSSSATDLVPFLIQGDKPWLTLICLYVGWLVFIPVLLLFMLNSPLHEWNAQSPRQIFKIRNWWIGRSYFLAECRCATKLRVGTLRQTGTPTNLPLADDIDSCCRFQRRIFIFRTPTFLDGLQIKHFFFPISSQKLKCGHCTDSLFCKWRQISLSLACGDYVSAVFRSLFLHKRKTRIVQRRGVTTRCIIVCLILSGADE
jgi:hypothetical protein